MDVAQAHPVALRMLDSANEILGFDLKKVCFEGSAEQLNTTTMSQPAIFAVSAAILEVLRTESPTADIKPDITAGLSLGEYTALYAAGAISFEQGLNLVHKRGMAMQKASDATEGGMVAVIGLDDDKVRELCEKAAQGELLEPVNFNCPGQVAVSGAKAACERAAAMAEKMGALKAVRLEVAGAFHTPMMSSAAETLAEALADCSITVPEDTAVLANITADYYQDAEAIRTGLTKQLTQPILWSRCMQRLIDDGVERFYEIGPGRVLTGLMRRINRKQKVINVSSEQAIAQLQQS